MGIEEVYMKIRTDFVTNSSSVSYIITMCEEIVEIYLKDRLISDKESDNERVINEIRDDLRKNGTCVFLEGKEIITKKIKFDTDETLTEDIRETPIKKKGDEELWSYIYGEFILNGNLSGFRGFGVTQIETY